MENAPDLTVEILTISEIKERFGYMLTTDEIAKLEDIISKPKNK